MFKSARLKLTAWYLLVIMSVSLAFSLVIYQAQVAEIERFATVQRIRLERRLFYPPPPMGSLMIDPDLVAETKNRLGLILIIINGGILITAGGLGYVLAGRTLKPIKDMVDEQNQFIGDASHELRTPLTAIKSALEVNLTDKKLLRACLDQVDKLQSLTEGLLQLSHDDLKMENVKLGPIIANAINIVTPKAKQKNISLQTSGKDVTVKGDKQSLTSLVTILLDNAIKYSSKKSLVRVEIQKTGFSVKDTGIGIGPKDLPHIFDRFYRADSARTKSDGGGYGLGLSIAKKIVNTHHGSIKVDSKINVGTTFSVSLPQ